MKKTFLFGVSLLLIFSQSVNCQSDTSSFALISQYSMEELMKIKIVSAEKHNQSVADVPASVVILTRSDIQSLGFENYQEILQHITGLFMIEDHYWLGSINYGVRGFFKNGPFSNMVVLVNGVSQLSDKYTDYPDVKITVPVEAIDRIEIIRGPMAVIYGNGAFFGVINIITGEANQNTTKSNLISLSGGSLSTYRSTIKQNGKKADLGYNIVASIEESKGLNHKYTDLTTDTSTLYYVGLTSNSTTQNHLSISKKYLGIALDIKGFACDISINESEKGVYDGLPAINNGVKINTKAINVLFKYERKLSSSLNANVNVGYYNHSHLLNYEQYRKYYYEIDYQQTSSADLDLNLFLDKKYFSLLSGVYRRTTLDILQLSDFAYYGLNYGDGKAGMPNGENYSTTSIYEQLTIKPFEKLKIVGGFRIEHLDDYNMYIARGIVSEDSTDNRLPSIPQNRYVIEQEYNPEFKGFSIFPRLSLIWEFTDNHFIKLLYGEATKQPSFTENYRQLPKNRPQLSSSRISTLEVNYITSTVSNLVLNTSIYYNYLNKLINSTNVYNNVLGEWEFYSTNSGKMSTLGIETSVQYFAGNKIKFNASCIYQHTENLQQGFEKIEVAYSPKLLLYSNLTYAFSKKISVSGLFRYVGSMETEWKTDSVPSAGYRIAPASKAYMVFDINFRTENLFVQNSYLNLKANNILNSEIRYPTTLSNRWIDLGSLAPGRTILLSLGYKF